MTHAHPTQRAAEVAPAPGDPLGDVAVWRLRRLLEAGFPQRLARELATTPGTDLHALLDLVDRGCPPHLAARILSPADGPADRPGDGRAGR